jgi:hypothetical protein
LMKKLRRYLYYRVNEEQHDAADRCLLAHVA